MTEYLEYKSAGGNDRSLHGAFACGDTVKFEVHGDAISVVMELHRDGEQDVMILFSPEGDGVFARTLPMSKLCRGAKGGLFWYRYRILTKDERTLYLGGESPRRLLPCADHGDRQLLVYRDGYKTPEWAKGCVIYHIFVDRFRRGGDYPVKAGAIPVPWNEDISEFAENPGDPVRNNTFYGGDLDGVCEMLPYIASLGTELVYLSPVFDSPSNHRYDTADYMRVDPMLGGDSALLRLCRRARDFGIRIILDGVFNHTGADSVYFNKFGRYGEGGACRSAESPYFPWYSFDRYPERYECWWGVDILPRVDSADPSFREFILGKEGVVRKYMRMGVAGWRLDVCDELADVFLQEFRSAVAEENPDGLILGEVWEDATSKIAYGNRRKYLRGGQLDSVMNYPFREAVLDYVHHGDAEKFRLITEGIFRRYPEEAMHCAMNMLGTHDTLRAITALAGESGNGKGGSELKVMRLSKTERERGRRMAVFAFGLLCALPGAVSVYYGDETGMEGYRDPFCRRPYPWGSEDRDMISAFAELGRLKRDTDALRRGEFEILEATPEVLEIHRYTEAQHVIAHFCRSGSAEAVFPEGYRVIYGDAEGDAEWKMCFAVK